MLAGTRERPVQLADVEAVALEATRAYSAPIRLALPDDPDLLHELANVRLRRTAPGVFRLDHDAGQHDDRAVSLGLAALALTERPPTGRGSVALPTGRVPKRSNDTAARPALPKRLGVALAA